MAKSYLNRAVITAAILAATTPAYGQSVVFEELVVTAQKRAQSTQDVSVAINAFSGDQVTDLGFTNTTDVVALMPGVQFNQTTGESSYSFSVRGVTQSDFADHQEAPVAVYVDEVYISQNPATGFALFDVERVEVLRGPQGTLFGRNATGGLLHFLTRKPSDETEGFIDIRGGSYTTRRFEAAVGGALTDGVRARLSGVWDANGPYITNNTGRDGGERDLWALRGQLEFDLGDSATLNLKGYGGRFETPTPFYWQWNGPVGPNAEGLPIALPAGPDQFGYQDTDGNPFEGSWNAEGGYFTEHYGFTATLNWELGAVNLVSITDFQFMDKEFIGDTDGGPDRTATNPLGGSGRMHYGNDTEADQWSQEIRIDGEWESGRWMAGVYYLEIDGRYEQYIGFSPDTAIAAGGNPIAFQDTNTWAIFGQVEYDLSDQLTLIAGARYTDDKKTLDFSNSVQLYLDGTNGENRVILVPNAASFSGEQDDGLFTAKVSLDWKPTDDILAYVSYNRGVKGGGFNHPIPPVQFADDLYLFEPEVLNAYEVGIKADLGDSVRFNGAAYYYDYSNYQAYQLIPGIVQNVFNRDAEMFGIDTELFLTLGDDFEAVLSAAYVDAKIKDVQLPTRIADRKPTKIPEFTASMLLRYSFDALDGRFTTQAEGNYQSSHFFDILNQPALEEPGYAVANLRLIYKRDDSNWSLSAYVENVFDKVYRVSGFALDNPAFMPLNRVANHARPRWFGISFRYEFGS